MLRRWAARGKIAMLRSAFAAKSTSVLASSLTDLNLSLKYRENAFSPDAENLITQAMGWKTVQVPRAALLTQQLTVPVLLASIRTRKSSMLRTRKRSRRVSI